MQNSVFTHLLRWRNRMTSIIRTSGDRCSFYMPEDSKNYIETPGDSTESGDNCKTHFTVRHTENRRRNT